jgi:hypothetical protein
LALSSTLDSVLIPISQHLMLVVFQPHGASMQAIQLTQRMETMPKSIATYMNTNHSLLSPYLILSFPQHPTPPAAPAQSSHSFHPTRPPRSGLLLRCASDRRDTISLLRERCLGLPFRGWRVCLGVAWEVVRCGDGGDGGGGGRGL